MQTNVNSSRIEEPFLRTLRRSVVIAVAVAAGIALFRHDFRVYLSLVVLALWPSLGGHYVEVAFVNYISARLPQAHWIQVVARLMVWFVGGVALYLCMFVTAQMLPMRPLPPGLWWCGGLAFIILELVLHVILAPRGNSEFYRARPGTDKDKGKQG